MRHLKAGRKLGRTSAHRKALFRNMVTALIRQERIQTTLAKAKELRGKVEKTITLGKKGTLHARRHALKLVANKDSLKKLFGPLAERYATRPGGYTRVIKLGHRLGDNAPMAFIELVDRENESTIKQSAKSKKKTKGASDKKVEDESKNAPEKDKKPPIQKKADKKNSDGGKNVEKTVKKKTVRKNP
jgi:large subunit ribosomal protein L17